MKTIICTTLITATVLAGTVSTFAPAESTQAQQTASDSELKTIFSYSLGNDIGHNIASSPNHLSADVLNHEIFTQAIIDGLNGTGYERYTGEKIREAVQQLGERRSGQPGVGAQTASATEEAEKVVSYSLGNSIGLNIAMAFNSLINIDDLDRDVFLQAIYDGMKGQGRDKYDEEQVKAGVRHIKPIIEERHLKNKAAADKFFEENGKKEGVQKTKSGLQYKVITQGNGPSAAAIKDTSEVSVIATYEARKTDGTRCFKLEEPTEIPLWEPGLPGVTEGLKMMPVGAEWELYVPAELGYGGTPMPPLQSGEALIFRIKVHDITNLPENAAKQKPAGE